MTKVGWKYYRHPLKGTEVTLYPERTKKSRCMWERHIPIIYSGHQTSMWMRSPGMVNIVYPDSKLQTRKYPKEGISYHRTRAPLQWEHYAPRAKENRTTNTRHMCIILYQDSETKRQNPWHTTRPFQFSTDVI